MNIDLTSYVVAKWGPWLKVKNSFTPNELKLGGFDDGVTLAGPLRVRVAVQALNQIALFDRSDVVLQAQDIFSYTLDIPPGQTWTYPAPKELGSAVGLDEEQPNLLVSRLRRDVLWGANAGFGIVIRPAGSDLCADPCRPVDPCAPKKKECHCGGGCGCGCEGHPDDLPCDFATGSGSHLGMFFPAACEPCAPGAFIGMPPVKGPSLMVPAARGGTVRTRYFNGMFITKEDLWTDQNNNRIKHALMNRAMGQGVVWGFNLCRDGDAICVLPGYGVDCCGNDIVLSSAYRVDAQALLRDPAAAATLAKGGAHRMHLLLEYFECPEEPRPVHGDPCSPETTRCETSRIRETARLRLIPPCDVDDSGPIKGFLDEIARLKDNGVMGRRLKTGAAPSVAPVAGPAPAAQVPFTVLIEGLDDDGVMGSLTLLPLLTTDTPPILVEGDVFATQPRLSGNTIFKRVRITLQAKTGFTFQQGMPVRTLPGSIPLNESSTPSTISWEDEPPWTLSLSSLASVSPISPQFAYQLQGWSLQDTNGSTFSAAQTEIDLTNLFPSSWVETPWGQEHREQVPTTRLRMILHVAVPPTDVKVSSPRGPSPWPCGTEECDPNGQPLFPVTPPFLHDDPANPGTAADPKVIVLAVLYAWLASEMARNGPNTPAALKRPQLEVATSLYNAVWKAFYATVPDTERYQLTDALQRLFQAWCRSFLYPGPKCECGCEPHGVVVGCTSVEGGEIRTIDPWGGRRWVIHYPILSYWGKQFGIMPLDAIASKFFHFICCIAGLPAPRGAVGRTTGVVVHPDQSTGRSSVVNLGHSTLIFAPPSEVPRRLQELGLQPAARVPLNPIDFVTRVGEVLSAAPTAVARQLLVHYTVAGLPELHFIAPGAAPTAPEAPGPAGGGAGRDRLGDFVRSAIENRPARSAVPSLLRSFAQDLTRGLLGSLPLQPASESEPERHAVERLLEASVATVGDLLDRDPEELLAEVFGGESGAAFADVIESSEKTARAVAKIVGDTVRTFAHERGVASRTALHDPDLQADLSQRFAERLAEAKRAIDLETVARAVESAAARRG